MENVTSTTTDNVTRSLEVTGIPFAATDAKLAALGLKLGEFYPYDSALASTYAEPDGTRLVKCLYKANAEGKKVAENSYTLVPTGHITEETVAERIAELAPYVVTFLQEWEDKAIKEQHKDGVTRIFTEYLTMDKVLAALEESEAGARLNAEKIGKWFVDTIQDSLLLAFMDKLGITDQPTPDQEARLATVLDAYRKKFESLASGKAFIKEADCKAMILVIQTAEAAETTLGRKFIARLEGMKAKEDDLLLAL